MASLLATHGLARQTAAGAVLVLEARDETNWKEGVQALVAELLTTGHELSVRAARPGSPEELERQLQLQVADSGASAGVAVTREGSTATALLCRHDVSSCERIRMETSEGELSRSRLAVAVVERLRPIDLPDAPQSAPPPTSATKSAPPREAVTKEATSTSERRLRAWLGGGATLSSGAAAPMAWLGASLGVMVAEPWGIELACGGSPLGGSADSRAGSLSLSALQGVAFATFEPFARRSFGFGLGLGGGALRLQETASPAPGFDGFSRHTTVGVVSARARVFHTVGPLYWGLSVDPGLLVPAVKIEAGTETLLRIGRPWFSLQTSLGIDL